MKINEIYESIQGELPFIGAPCTVVRLAGCNLSCPYCDAPNLNENVDMDVDHIFSIIEGLRHRNILITGGEPLLQREELCRLLDILAYRGKYTVSIETNGTINPEGLLIDSVVMDVKLFKDNFDVEAEHVKMLESCDVVKFVYQDEEEMRKAFRFIIMNDLHLPQLVFSPIHVDKPYMEMFLAFARTAPTLDLRLQIQIHKFLGAR